MLRGFLFYGRRTENLIKLYVIHISVETFANVNNEHSLELTQEIRCYPDSLHRKIA